mmetsp:Transcript_23252/g.27958  ORF Transcript_23252/g.27958 Transcript_23252/m.27958 type:complete len:154 (-) Transcript_23252:111-572(-)
MEVNSPSSHRERSSNALTLPEKPTEANLLNYLRRGGSLLHFRRAMYEGETKSTIIPSQPMYDDYEDLSLSGKNDDYEDLYLNVKNNDNREQAHVSSPYFQQESFQPEYCENQQRVVRQRTNRNEFTSPTHILLNNCVPYQNFTDTYIYENNQK